MRRNYRLLLSIIAVILSGVFAFAQEVEYKDVILDGKPAKLNLGTGEITLVSEWQPINLKQNDTLITGKSEVKDSISVNLESDFHTVKEKETLLDIANKYNTSLTELKRINNLETTLVDKGQVIRVRHLDIKEGSEVDEITNEVIVIPEPEVILNPSNEAGYTKSSTEFHTVEKGQTLYSLAKLYGLTVDELKLNNGLNSNLIKTGQELRISNFDSRFQQEQLSTWTVSKGDTLYNIARRNNTTVDELKSINGLTSNLILVGQKLKLK